MYKNICIGNTQILKTTLNVVWFSDMNINRIINDALRDALTTKLSRGNGRSKIIK